MLACVVCFAACIFLPPGNGELCAREFGDFVRGVVMKGDAASIGDGEIDALFRFLDKDESGAIDKAEFDNYLYDGINLDDI